SRSATAARFIPATTAEETSKSFSPPIGGTGFRLREKLVDFAAEILIPVAELAETIDDGHATMMDLLVRRRLQKFFFEHPERRLERENDPLPFQSGFRGDQNLESELSVTEHHRLARNAAAHRPAA